jgi:hypothetical protein
MAKNSWSELTMLIERIFDDVQSKGFEQIQVNCPRCQEREDLPEPDGKHNLEINLQKRKFRCWKCDDPFFSGDLLYLVRLFGSYDDIKEYKEYVENNFDSLFDEEEKKVVVETVELPKEFIPFSDINTSNPDHMEAYKYLIFDRKLTREIILRFRLGFCLEGRYKKRIIIPSFDANGMINYFVGRTYVEGHKPPYDNVKASKDSIIFNEGFIDWDATVYLVEGPFDYLSFPINTIPLLGKTLGKKLFYTLKEKKPDVIIILDPDAWRNSMVLYQQLLTIYHDCEQKVKIVKLNVWDVDVKGKKTMYDLDEIKRNKGVSTVIEEIKKARQLVDDDYLYVK